MHIAIIHLNVVTGGATKLMIDIAHQLVLMGHIVHFYTTSLDKNTPFISSKNVNFPIKSITQNLPLTIGGRFRYFCLSTKLLLLSLRISFTSFDCVITDKEPLPLIILKMSSLVFNRPCKFIYYCHYPEKLGKANNLYTKPQIWFEEKCIKLADHVFVNSKFTRDAFIKAYPSYNNDFSVLYPCAFKEEDVSCKASASFQKFLDALIANKTKLLLCLNRFDPCKRFELAIETLSVLKKNSKEPSLFNVKLVLAGPHEYKDKRGARYLESLRKYILKLELAPCDFPSIDGEVIIVTSLSESDKYALISASSTLLFTNNNEPFGIVPVEAMYVGTPVVGVASGGLLETIIEGETGYLTEQNSEAFAEATKRILSCPVIERDMCESGKRRVKENFSEEKFRRGIQDVLDKKEHRFDNFNKLFAGTLGLLFVFFVLMLFVR